MLRFTQYKTIELTRLQRRNTALPEIQIPLNRPLFSSADSYIIVYNVLLLKVIFVYVYVSSALQNPE